MSTRLLTGFGVSGTKISLPPMLRSRTHLPPSVLRNVPKMAGSSLPNSSHSAAPMPSTLATNPRDWRDTRGCRLWAGPSGAAPTEAWYCRAQVTQLPFESQVVVVGGGGGGGALDASLAKLRTQVTAQPVAMLAHVPPLPRHGEHAGHSVSWDQPCSTNFSRRCPPQVCQSGRPVAGCRRSQHPTAPCAA